MRAAGLSGSPSADEVRVRHRGRSRLKDYEVGSQYPAEQKWQIGVIGFWINKQRSEGARRLQAGKSRADF